MKIPVLEGFAQKLALPVLALSAVGWFVYIVAFGWLNNNTFDNETDDKREDAEYFPYWAATIVGPIFYIVALVYILSGKWYIGVISQFLTGFYLLACGGVLYFDGLEIDRLGVEDANDFEDGRYLSTEFTGCLLSSIFLVAYMMLSTLFTNVEMPEFLSGQRQA